MKKLLLILLCLPFIGFGQEKDRLYEKSIKQDYDFIIIKDIFIEKYDKCKSCKKKMDDFYLPLVVKKIRLFNKLVYGLEKILES